MTNFYKKYLKYKSKYLKLIGGMDDQEMCDCPCEFVNITTLDGSEYNISLINPRITMVHQLKERLSKKLGIKPEQIELYLENGVPICDNLTLQEQYIIDGTNLQCVIKYKKSCELNELMRLSFTEKCLNLLKNNELKNEYLLTLKEEEQIKLTKLLTELHGLSDEVIVDYISMMSCIGCELYIDDIDHPLHLCIDDDIDQLTRRM